MWALVRSIAQLQKLKQKQGKANLYGFLYKNSTNLPHLLQIVETSRELQI